MCGIAGFIGERMPGNRRVLNEMSKVLAPRGPDDEQYYEDSCFGFVFRRLAIVDVANGGQPIWNEDRTMFVAVNGEIYNHKSLRKELISRHHFRTESDSEVVLHLFEEHGAGCLEFLNGIFALAIWEPQRRRLFLARDRLGVKPLVYSQRDRNFVFASESKAVLMHPSVPSTLAWPDLLAVPSEPHPIPRLATIPSFLEYVQHLPAGHYLWVEGLENGYRAGEPCCYWSAQDQHTSTQMEEVRSPEEAVALFEELLHDSVQLQLMADVPVGIFLSGGLDSSAVASIAAASGSKPICFHIADRANVFAGDTARARQLATVLGCPLHVVQCDVNDIFDRLQFSLSALEQLIWVMDSPRFSHEVLLKHELHRYVRTVHPEVKVMLLGQGADEFAGGYTGQKTWWDSVKPLLVEDILEGRKIPQNFWPFIQCEVGSADDNTIRRARSTEIAARAASLQYHNLWHEDRTAASFGTEARVPFLDHRIVELLVKLPYVLWPQLFQNKEIVRRGVERFLGKFAQTTPKVGFLGDASFDRLSVSGAQLIKRLWPEFREKYVGQSDSLFKTEQMDALFAELSRDSLPRSRAAAFLMHLVCICIFERQCRLARDNGAPTTTFNPSTLGTLDPVTERLWLGM